MFTERLRYYRKQNGLTANMLAHQIGISRSKYMEFESGERRPNREELDAIVNVLKISIYDLFACGDYKKIQVRNIY
ncbi:MAG: helix-turn-helix transcriptional regulator [bacterium]|nr:helix-turn-helix transcriptional regulator [bacterium]